MTERNITHRLQLNKQLNTVHERAAVSFDVYVTDGGTYTIVLEDCIMFDRELDVDEFDEILENLLNDEENEDGWVMANFDVRSNTFYEMT